MEAALRLKQRAIVFQEGAHQFMNGHWMELLHTMCKVYILYVHRNDMTWMQDCYRWYESMDIIQQSNPQDHKQWQQHKQVRHELFELLSRLLKAPHEFYLNVMQEWGVYWKGSGSNTSHIDRNVQALLSQAKSVNQMEQMRHMIQMSNESYQDSIQVWTRASSIMSEIMSLQWLDVSQGSRLETDRQQTSFDGLVQSFFYLIHSLLYDSVQQFGSQTVHLSQQHLWALIIEDETPEQYEVWVPSVPVQAFRNLLECFADASMNTSGFLVVCMLLAHRIKTLRYILKGQSTPSSAPALINDPYHYHHYEQHLIKSHGLDSTFGGKLNGRTVKNVIEFKEEEP